MKPESAFLQLESSACRIMALVARVSDEIGHEYDFTTVGYFS